MFGRSTKSMQPSAVIGLHRSRIDLVVLRPNSDGTASVHSRSVLWRKASANVASEAGMTELRQALKPLVAEFRLAGVRTSFSLDGDFCVTRVVTGTSDRVRTELGQLEQRSALYLSLGAGPKALAVSLRQLDARHQHALLSVIGRRTLDAIVQVAGEVGLKIDRIEPSLVATSRALGHMGRDADRPVLIVNLGERGAELGISHRGQLLLDYRPGGRSASEDLPEIVSRHMARLQRYCQRYFRFADAKIEQVYLCGLAENLATVQSGFEQHGLMVDVLNPKEIESRWNLENPDADSGQFGTFGSALLDEPKANVQPGPNLMDRFGATSEEPLFRQLLRTCWPVAAMLLVAAGMWSAAILERLASADAEQQLATFEPQQNRLKSIHAELVSTGGQIKGLESIRSQLHSPQWSNILTTLAQCMPGDVWLEQVMFESSGKLKLVGAGYTEDSVYELIQSLQQNPLLQRVTLEETRPAVLPSGPATGFGINGSLADFSGHVKPTDTAN